MRFIWLFCILLCPINVAFAIPLKPPQYRYENLPKVDQHPGFDPFISHIDFRLTADYVIDQSAEYFDPDWIKKGDIIYVNIWFLEWFEQHVHDQIKHPYILISCDVGGHVPEIASLNKILYDPKCAAWFCRNMMFSYHPKLHQLPWGQDIWFWNTDPGIIQHLADATNQKPFVKNHLLYMNHLPRPFGDRDKIVRLFEKAPYCFTRNSSNQPLDEYRHLPYSQYYHELASSRFVLSPFGVETDSVRTWEALVLDCIPIVEHTFLDPQYEGLPVVFVHDWEEITEEFLLSKYEELKNKSTEKAYLKYWREKIKECQNRIRQNDHSFSSLEASQFEVKDLQDLVTILRKHGNSNLIYWGFLATLRPLELAKAFDSLNNIFLYDPWLDSATWNQLGNYLIDRSLLTNKQKIFFLNNEDYFNQVMSWDPTSSIFLDLTYYRNSLVKKDGQYNNFRHSLKKDLQNLYLKMQKGTLLCGNMINDEYVKKVLTMFAEENHLQISTQGSFWFFSK